MLQKQLLIIALLYVFPVQAEEMERSTITTCAYQAGTAREIQLIRQSEGDDWSQFEQKIKQIYKDTPGRSDLLVIAKNVYLQPITTLPTEAYEKAFTACVSRIQGTEPSA
ncbi:MAG: hypothetical protein OEY48_04870 [Gammaproteobacteria bacterium]|nr:hypothetical protein [Gammaproteobacteria bacterium]MDH5592162.1 hypothetical protein [Gammaproteobacteria bacterium]